jgi:DNA replication protein DnaC
MPAWPQTRNGKLGHLEFLQVLCEDEIGRRESAAVARRVRRARFEQPNTFDDFDFTVSPKLPSAMLRDLAALRWLDTGESLILYGPVGVGKTHVAQALGHQVARRGGDIRSVKYSRMLADLAGVTLIAPSVKHARIHPPTGADRRRLRDARTHPDPKR